ncbi:ThuA domain-containing protein [Aquirufa sp. Wall-65K1]
MKKSVFLGLFLLVFFSISIWTPLRAQKNSLKNSRVLVYTKNGVGYVHDNIPSAVACIQDLGLANKFLVDVSDDPTVFAEANLKKYTLIIFTSTNNDVFATDEQRLAFRRYIEAGGGFVGVHSVTGTERKWSWFKSMVGETFTWHANFQSFSLININPKHPSMEGIPAVWTKEDECYFGREMYPGIQVLMMHDVRSLDKKQSDLIQKHVGTFGDYFPAVWFQHFQGGNIWVTTLGHSKTDYQNPSYRNHLLQGIKYVASQFKGIDFNKAFSTGKDDQLRFDK